MKIEFKKLTEVDKSSIIDLMNNALVRRQMPLLKGEFTKQMCDAFVATKEKMWEEHGYGPWAFVIEDEFAGWGGIQAEEGEADLALVLHPDYWGLGKVLYKKIIHQAFGEMDLDSVIVLFPPSRTRVQGLLRLGFVQEQELNFGQERFIRYRLKKSSWTETLKKRI